MCLVPKINLVSLSIRLSQMPHVHPRSISTNLQKRKNEAMPYVLRCTGRTSPRNCTKSCMCCTVLHMYRYIHVLCVIFPRTRWPKQFMSDPDTSSLNVRMKTTRLHSVLDKPSYNNLHSRKGEGGESQHHNGSLSPRGRRLKVSP